jgi:hypothetical protein
MKNSTRAKEAAGVRSVVRAFYENERRSIGRRRGDYVWMLFDTGIGTSIVYGVIVAAGARSMTVQWESGIRNRFAQGDRAVRFIPYGTEDWRCAVRAIHRLVEWRRTR